ncbi:TetR/AcrR family transcriptional regulator [Agromyces sp. MMS24-K17]|uniref:TetR/AcrR family transcriptional regulator n=1 Tax=Agromyces sp. MMS24-K17 TaxID=3372850 RepID=UPI0037546AD4
MSSATSTRRDARRNHERLLEEARRLFAERGIDAPLDELATRAGVGAGTVYRHFPTRDALLRELYDAAIKMFHDLGPEVQAAGSGWDAIQVVLERLGQWVAATPYLPALMRRVAAIDGDYRPGLEFAPVLEGIVERAKAEGSLRPDVEAADILVLIDMLGSLGQFGGTNLPFWRRQFAIVLEGIRARPGQEPLPGVALDFDEFHDLAHHRAETAAENGSGAGAADDVVPAAG